MLLAAVFLALWILPPFWGIATLQTVNIQDDIFASDLWNDRLPTRAFVGASLRRGESPFWMPGIYTGFPSLAQIEIGALYPPNLLLFGLLSPYAAFAWAQITALAIAGIGMFLLAGELGLAFEGRLLAAGAFSLSGFFISHLRQINMVDAGVWLPFLVLMVERIAVGRPGRAPLALAVLWALELLAGHPQISYFTALFLLVYLGVRLLQTRTEAPRPVASSIWRVAVPLAFGTLIAAAQLLPTIELSRLTYREGGLSFEAAAKYAVSAPGFWTLFVPGLFGDARDDTWRTGLYWEQYGYVGLLPVLLAIFALVRGRRDRHVRGLAVLTTLGCVLMLGEATPLFGWAFAVVPGMRYFRFPTRFLLFVEFGLCLLAGLGLTACLRAAATRQRRFALAAAILALTAADLWVHQMQQVPQVEWPRWLSPIETQQTLERARAASSEPWRYYTLDPTVVHRETFHAAHGWSGDLAPYVALRSLLQPSFNLLFGLETPNGYSNLVPVYYEAVWGSEKILGIVPVGHFESGELEPELMRLLRMFNVKYVLSARPIRSAALKAVMRSPEGVEIFELADPLPRAFVVGEIVHAKDDAAAITALGDAAFDPQRQAVVTDAALTLPPDAAGSTRVRIVGRTNTELVLRAGAERPGLLVLSEGYYPGWRVTVDGTDAALWRVNVMMRGVVLSAGEHEIVFRFRSPVILAGFALSALALVMLGLFANRLSIRRVTS